MSVSMVRESGILARLTDEGVADARRLERYVVGMLERVGTHKSDIEVHNLGS